VTAARSIRTAQRLGDVQPFYVMEVAKAADALARTPACDPAQGGEPMINLYIGEPDFTAAPAVLSAAQACLQRGQTQYTHAPGLWALRQRIAAWYGSHFNVDVDPERILVTAGGLGGAAARTAGLFEPRRRSADAGPCYPATASSSPRRRYTARCDPGPKRAGS
jgi:aspartate/methionine/tyrosine aminotransferase